MGADTPEARCPACHGVGWVTPASHSTDPEPCRFTVASPWNPDADDPQYRCTLTDGHAGDCVPPAERVVPQDPEPGDDLVAWRPGMPPGTVPRGQQVADDTTPDSSRWRLVSARHSITSREHWTARALGGHADYSDNPLWGHIAQDDYGELLLPSWRNPRPDEATGGWWGRRLNLRNPLHWLPYLRSRLTGRCAAVDSGDF